MTTISLPDPIWHGIRRVDTITMRPIVPEDQPVFEATRPGNLGDCFRVASQLSGIPFDVLQDLTDASANALLAGMLVHFDAFDRKRRRWGWLTKIRTL